MGENTPRDDQRPERQDRPDQSPPPRSSEPPRQVAQPSQAQAQQQAPAPPVRRKIRRRRGSRLLRVIVGGLLLVSIVMNVYLLLLVAAHMTGPFETAVVRDGDRSQTVAVYEISGIIDGRSVGNFSSFSREVVADGNVRAVVLRVDSPGGGVAASDQIHRLVKELRQSGRKVVVSMGAVAASGGYYVSAPADEIVAEPTSITGSIGVMMQWFVLKGTLEKLGVEPVVMRSENADAWKDEISLLEPPRPHHREHLQDVLNTMQARFEEIVRDGRKGRLRTTTVERTVQVGQGEDAREVTITETEPLNGKIYLAEEALEFGLIDQIGYTDSAIDRAAALANLSDPHVVRYQTRRPLIAQLLGRAPNTGALIEPDTIDRLRSPRMMLLWKAE